MGDTNIKIDYQKVTDMVQSANGVIDGALNAAAASFARAGSGMNKSEGEMLDAIDKQIEAEKELAKSMADACRQFTSSIQNAAQSFQVLDASLSSKMGIKKRI